MGNVPHDVIVLILFDNLSWGHIASRLLGSAETWFGHSMKWTCLCANAVDSPDREVAT